MVIKDPCSKTLFRDSDVPQMYYLFIKVSYITHATFSKLLGSTGYIYAVYIKYLLTCVKLYSEIRSELGPIFK